MTVLRSVFGPTREVIWKELSREVGGAFVKGSMFRPDAVQASVGDWIITLDTYDAGGEGSTYTRLRAPYVNPTGLKFTLSHSNLFKEMGKLWFGTQDIEVGDKPFDSKFIVQGNEPAMIRELLSNPKIREMALAEPHFYMTVKDDEGWFAKSFPDGVDELYFHAPKVIKDVERLKALFDLFAEVLHHLTHLGQAYEDDIELLTAKLQAPGGTVGQDLIRWEGDPPRHQAAIDLGRTKDVRALGPLLAALDDDDLHLRAIVIQALAEVGSPIAVPRLVALLGQGGTRVDSRSIRVIAAEALEALGAIGLVRAFRSALNGDADAVRVFPLEMREELLEALTGSLDDYSLPPRLNALRALSVLGAVEVVPLLRQKLRRFGPRVKFGAACKAAIAELESRASLPRPAGAAPASDDSDTLPRPAALSDDSTHTLPRAVED